MQGYNCIVVFHKETGQLLFWKRKEISFPCIESNFKVIIKL